MPRPAEHSRSHSGRAETARAQPFRGLIMSMVNAFSRADFDRLDESERALIARREKVLGPAYRLFYEKPLHLVRGEGVFLYDTAGERYLDAYNNVASLGHCHPR